jgi:hypothetical protein
MFDIVLREHGTKNERELMLEVLNLQFHNKIKLEEIMATLADLQASVSALATEVALIPQAGAPMGISAADADTIKAGIDAQTAAITAKLAAPTS